MVTVVLISDYTNMSQRVCRILGPWTWEIEDWEGPASDRQLFSRGSGGQL